MPGGVVNGLANVMFAQTEHPEEARRFLDAATGRYPAVVLGSGTAVCEIVWSMSESVATPPPPPVRKMSFLRHR